MSIPLTGPGDRYSAAVEVLASPGDESFSRYRVSSGEPLWDTSGQGRPYRVVVGDACTMVLNLGENGLTLQSLKLLGPAWTVVTAVVTAGSGAPDWLPTESNYLLFQGDRAAAGALKDRYVPLAGMAEERSWADASATPLDQLAIAVGRSIARANAVLARSTAPSGTALVAGVTIRVGVTQTDLEQGRVLVSLARPGGGQDGGESQTNTCTTQYVELRLTTVPGATPAPAEEEGAAVAQPGAGAQTPGTASLGGAQRTALTATTQQTPFPGSVVQATSRGGAGP